MALSSEALGQILERATSPDQYTRSQAVDRLLDFQKSASNEFFEKLFDLLASRDRKMHILSYSYFLHEVVFKFRRFPEYFLKKLEKVYFFFNEIAREEYTFGPNSYEMQEQNVVNLIAYIYSQPTQTKERNDFFQQNVNCFDTNQYELKMYIKKIIEKLVQLLNLSERKQSFKLHSIFLSVMSQLWRTGGLFNYETVIALSYLSPLFPQDLWRKFVELLSNQATPEGLLLKIIKRSSVALALEFHKPNYETCIELYKSLQNLALKINLQKISEENLLDILSILYHTLHQILTFKFSTYSQNYEKKSRLLSITEYDMMINWLVTISSDCTEQDDQRKLISQRAIDIVILYSQKIPEQTLLEYFKRIYQEKSCQYQEQLLFLLSGAPRRVHQMLNSEQIINRILQNPQLCLNSRSNSYFFFLEKWISNEYYVQELFVDHLFQFVQVCLGSLENALNTISSKSEQQQLTIKISILLSAFLLSGKYPRNPEKQNSFLEFSCFNIFKYLAGAQFGLPDLAHEKLYESVNNLLSLDIPNYSFTFCNYAIKIYHGLYITSGELSSEKERSSSKIRQELLSIIKRTLNHQTLKSDDQLNMLFDIFKRVNSEDLVISKSVLFLLGKYLQFYNVMVIQLQLYQIMNYLDADKDYINFSLKNSINEIMFSEKFHEFLAVISSNLQYDFTSTIDLFLQQFLEALKLLIQMSIHRYCFGFVEQVAYQLIIYLKEEQKSLEELYEKSRKKHIKINFSVIQLKRLPTYLDCLLEILYLNPKWRHPSYQSPIKQLIIQTQTFQKCKERIDRFVAGDITKMMEQVSIEGDQKRTTLDRWDKVYVDILTGSGVGEFCEVWINMLKEASF